MAKKIDLQLGDNVVMIAMTIIRKDEAEDSYSVEQRLYTTEDLKPDDG